MNFIDALNISESVFQQYKIDQPKWWKRMDGTPILNDIAVRMANAFVANEKAEILKSTPRCLKNHPCDCETNCGDDKWPN